MKKKYIFLCFFTIIIFIIPSCYNKKISSSYDSKTFKSFYDIPGITCEEIEAIEFLKKTRSYFIYGAIKTTEAFLGEDGEIKGYTAFLCEWLTELFDIPFIPKHFSRNGLLDGLKNGSVDFTGELSPVEERRKYYIMTSDTAHRWLRCFRLEGSESINEIAKVRPVCYVLVEESVYINEIYSSSAESFESVFVFEYDDAYELLKEGKADAIITENTSEAFFDAYTDIIAENYFPHIDSPVSLSTQNPKLEPIISVMQKALEHGAGHHLSFLYEKGYNEYIKQKLHARFTAEEKEYIQLNTVIPYAAEHDNYPSSFYSTRSREWQGVIFDVLEQVETLTGLKFNLINDERTDWHEILEKLETGQALFVAELLWTEDREGRFLWPNKTIFFDKPVLLSKSDMKNISTNNVPVVKVGLPRATAHAELFHRWFPNHMNTITYESQDATYKALFDDEVDMIMISFNNMLYLTNYLERVDIKPNIIFDHIYESTFGFHKDAAILCSIIDKTLEFIDLGIISDQWTNRTYDYRAKIAEAQRPWFLGSISLILIVLALVVINFYRNKKVSVEQAVLRESEEQVKLMLNSTPLAVNLIDKNFRTVIVNDEALRLFGLKTEQEYKEHIFNDLSPEYQPDGMLSEEKGITLMKKAFEEGFARFEWIHKNVDGELFPCDIRFVKIKYKDDFAIAGYARDLREERATIEKIRKTEEEKLTMEEANQNLQTILDMLPVGIIIISKTNAELLYANKSAVGIYKGTSFEEDGKNRIIYEFAPEYQPDGRKTVDVVMELFTLESSVAEMQHKRLNGDLFWIRAAHCHIFYKGFPATLTAIEDITAELQYQNKLHDIAVREQEANQLKSRFLATMSHEIRTPMNAIIGMSELALRENTMNAKNEHIHTVKQAASNLLAIINDILDFSKIEAGKMEITSSEYSVASLLYDIVSIIRMRVVDSNVSFAVKADSNIPDALYGDETRIRQAVLNILINAVKFTEKGYVSLSVCHEIINEENINLIFEVHDTGIGIKEEDISKLFLDFTQFNLDNTRAGVEGVGLGLAITHSIVNLMDGDIKVQSEYGAGSTFTVRLPQKIHSKAKLAVIEDAENKNILVFVKKELLCDSLLYTVKNLGMNCTVVKNGTELYKIMEENKNNILFISSELYNKNEETILQFGKDARIAILTEFGSKIPEINPAVDCDLLVMPVYCVQIADVINGVYSNDSYMQVNENIVLFQAPQANVLVVDDINTNLRVAEGLLAPYGMNIELCSSGKDAIEAVKNKKYDLIFMDHKMPGIDGVEATKQIRAWEHGSSTSGQVPIIALTANAVSGMMEIFIENGFNDFISKPIDTVKLNTILEKWIPDNMKQRGGGGGKPCQRFIPVNQ